MSDTKFDPPDKHDGHDHDHDHRHHHDHHDHHHHRPHCFLAGTLIETPTGTRAVETLAPGDAVCTLEHGVQPLRWVGRSTIHSQFADPLLLLPVCIAAGALGDRLPLRDLWLSPDHAVFLDGILVNAGALINGETIYRMAEMPAQFTYFHLELETHELLLAEGVAAESFLDNAGRWGFDNAAEYEALGPAAIVEMPYPRAKSTRQLPAELRAMLAGLRNVA
jgi:Hint domain